MSKTAFLFPGQGSQYVGMGKDFYDNFSIARTTFDLANNILNYDLKKICFEGPEELLMQTENTQPAILTTSVAILRVLQSEGLSCDYTAGLSLGEYTALINANAIDFEDAVKLVQHRGLYMQQAVPRGVGRMGAIVGLSLEQVENIIENAKESGIIQIANYNTNEQLVITGEKKAVNHAIKLAKKLGARRALPLPVSAPFHCELLKPAGEMLEQDLGKITFKQPSIPVITNVDARPLTNKENIIISLKRQVSHSVLWKQSMEFLLKRNVTNFFEIGPGTTLSNFMKAIAADMKKSIVSLSIQDLAGLSEVKTNILDV